jgi:hypothetical protein
VGSSAKARRFLFRIAGPSRGSLNGASFMDNTNQDAGRMPFATPPTLPPMAPVLLMTAFWMLLGGASGIRVAQSIWQLLSWEAGDVSVAVPLGGVIGAAVGAALGQISSPRLLVLLMAVFAGAAAGGVAGKIPWGEIGEIGGQVAGGLVGGIAWAAWLFFGPPNRASS